ncbi:hypothetical protein DL239_20010 [Sedimentitalea sp. CY04]|uniref:Lipoprotein n=1 Tax=Parasedimentitalea denitrificans TaxID=2211118 RepID=A0ABX0WFX5_9RHOB|nr:hypothetical protein [Sedimentitalea sp. CY04]
MKLSKNTLAPLMLVVALAGCEISRGGAGQMTNGEPIIGEIWQNSALEEGISITSVNGWQCTGKLTKAQSRATNSVITIPLTCSGDLTGTALVAVDRPKAEVDINFRLSNGKVGQLSVS